MFIPYILCLIMAFGVNQSTKINANGVKQYGTISVACRQLITLFSLKLTGLCLSLENQLLSLPPFDYFHISQQSHVIKVNVLKYSWFQNQMGPCGSCLIGLVSEWYIAKARHSTPLRDAPPLTHSVPLLANSDIMQLNTVKSVFYNLCT